MLPWIISGSVTVVVIVGALVAIFRTLLLVGKSEETEDDLDLIVSA